VWVIVILTIFALCSMYNPTVMTVQGNKWTIEAVRAASERNDIVSGVIQGIPTKGFEWYKLYGEAKNTGENITSSPSAHQVVVNGDNMLKKFNNTLAQSNTNKDTVTVIAEVRLTPNRSDHLIELSKVWVEKPSSALWSDTLVNTVPDVIFSLLIFSVLGKRLHEAGKSTMALGKSRAKLLTQDKKKSQSNMLPSAMKQRKKWQKL
jgi:ATP-dependent Zn protease